MSMFDNISLRCTLPVEIPDSDKAHWQTKSLDCDMSTYIIMEDGKLKRIDYRGWKKVPSNGEPWYMQGIIRHTRPRLVDVTITGSIRFYDKLSSGWWEFCAFVEKGIVQKIICTEQP